MSLSGFFRSAVTRARRSMDPIVADDVYCLLTRQRQEAGVSVYS